MLNLVHGCNCTNTCAMKKRNEKRNSNICIEKTWRMKLAHIKTKQKFLKKKNKQKMDKKMNLV